MKFLFNSNLKELDDGSVTISAFIVTLNLTVKWLAIDELNDQLGFAGREFYLEVRMPKMLYSDSPSSPTTLPIT